MNGDVVWVDDVPTAFADLVVREQPRIFALSGGGTARRCYEALAGRSGIDWPSVQVIVGDERMVPVEHEDSNEGMARQELLDHVPVLAIHSMAMSTPEGYEAMVRGIGTIDLVHLGMGPDGHTASMFPGTPALEETERFVVMNEPRLEPFVERMTLTLPAIATARHAVFTVEGDDKREAFEQVMAGEDLPAARVTAGRVTWLVDRSLSS